MWSYLAVLLILLDVFTLFFCIYLFAAKLLVYLQSFTMNKTSFFLTLFIYLGYLFAIGCSFAIIRDK